MKKSLTCDDGVCVSMIVISEHECAYNQSIPANKERENERERERKGRENKK